MAGFSILAKLGLDSSKFASSLKSQDTAMSKFGTAIGTAVKAGAAIAGAAFTAFTIKGIKDIIEFEKSISEVFTLMPGITEDSMASMSDSVRKLSTTMGVDLGDATAALYQAISAGVPQDNVFEFMEIAAKASVGGVTDLETAVDGITTAINTYGSANLSAKDAADSMFTAVKLGKTTFDELSGALFNVLPIAKQAGVAFDEVTAALAVMTSKGTPTAVATTQLRAALTALIAPTADTAKAFQDYGLDVENLKALLAGGDGGLVKAMQNVMVATNGDETAIRKLLGSTEAMNAVFTLTAGGAKSVGDAMEEMGNKTGATDAAFAVMEKTVGHQLDKLMASFKNLGLSVGNAFLPMINKVLPDIIAGFNNAVGPVEKFAKTFPALLVSVVDLAATFVRFGVILVSYVATAKAVAVVTTGVAMAKNALAIATKGASIAMQLFNKVSKANIIGLVVAAAVAAAMAFKQWAKHQEALNTVMRPSGEFLKEMAKGAKDAAKEYENAKDRVKHLKEQLDELNRQDSLKAEGITELQDALELRKESLAVLKEQLVIQLDNADMAEQRLADDERRLKLELKSAKLPHERLAIEKEIKQNATAQESVLEATLQLQLDIKLAENDILEIEKKRTQEIEDAKTVQVDTKKILADVHNLKQLEKTEVGKIQLLEMSIRDLELQKKNLIDNSIVSRNLEAGAAKDLETIEGNIFDKREQIEGIIKGALKVAQDAELLRIKDLVTELDKALAKEQDRAREAGDAAKAKEEQVAALRKDLKEANLALEPLAKFFNKDQKGKITINTAEARREFDKLLKAGKLPPNTETLRDFQQMLTDQAVAAKTHRDNILEDGAKALADAFDLWAMEKDALDEAKRIEQEIADEKERIIKLEEEAADKEKKTLEDLTKEREAWEKALKDWQVKLNMVPPETATLANAINQQGDTLTSIDDAIGDALNGKNQVDEEANREKTQKDLLTTAEETLSVVSGYFVNQ